jgi:Restriction Enzyme Adenine Methylase Associated
MAAEAGSSSAVPQTQQLAAVLGEVGARIARHRGASIGEQNTKLTLINPVLRALGWDVEDLEDVQHEYRRLGHDKPVDYALMLARKPKLFVEAKGLDENLNDPRWANQIISYATVAGVEWVVLTNGDEYRIYNAHAPVPVEQKLFRAVQIAGDVDASAEALMLLSKEKTQEESLRDLWTAYSVDRRVKDAIEPLFAEPSPWLVRGLARQLDALSAGDVRAALSRARVQLDFPVEELPQASRRVAEIEEPRPRAAGRARPRKTREPTPEAIARVSLVDLIEAGLIRPPLDLMKRYKGRQLSARIEHDGRVSSVGETYDSLSTAAGMARKSVVGAPPGRKYPQTNGWTFWQFRDEDGQVRDLTVLRERFVARGAGGLLGS